MIGVFLFDEGQTQLTGNLLNVRFSLDHSWHAEEDVAGKVDDQYGKAICNADSFLDITLHWP